jgi:ribonuclease PH
MTAEGELVEVQGTGESRPFSRKDMDELLTLAEDGIRRLFETQRIALAEIGIFE